MAKPSRPTFVSPKGIFSWPALVKPDYGTKEHPKPEGVYKTNLRLLENDPATKSFIAKLQPIMDAAKALAAEEWPKLKVDQRKKLKEVTINDLFSIEYDKDTEEPTGYLLFRFSTKASGVSEKGEWNRKLPLFNAKGRQLNVQDKATGLVTKCDNVGGGSSGKVSFEAVPYWVAGTGTAGVKFYLLSAQVIDLVQFGERDAAGYGFGEEDGYEGHESYGDESNPHETHSNTTEAPEHNPDF